MRISLLQKPWAFAIAGALLILGSTFIIGVVAFREEQALLKTQKELEENRSQTQETQRYYDMAKLQTYLAVLQRSTMTGKPNRDRILEEQLQRGFAESLFSALSSLYIAAGKNAITQEHVEELKSLSVPHGE